MVKGKWDQIHLPNKHVLRLDCVKLVDIEQGEKEAPDKLLDRWQEIICKFTNVDSKIAEGEIILKDFSLFSSISTVSH